jgi:aspartate/methionine/tyrosine aminotransferase
MRLTPFLLDQWLSRHASSIDFNLGGSTGPRWTISDLLQLTGGDAHERLLQSDLVYGLSAGSEGLRDAIAGMRNVPSEHVLVVAGGSEALLLLMYLAAEPGANVIVPFPGFPPYHALPESMGLEVRRYHVRREDQYRVDLDEVKRRADAKTKLIVVNSPHNPTGGTLTDDEMRELHDFAAERRIQFVSDEVFHPVYHGPASVSAARLPHATVIGDFSKAFALSGLRLGWIIEPDHDRREEYLNMREYVSISNTTVGEFFAEIAVRHHEVVLGRTQEVASTNLRLVERLVEEHADTLDWIRPAGGMTAFIRVRGGSGREFCEGAVEHGLLLTPGDCFGVPDHVRLGFGVGPDWYPTAMDRLANYLQRWKAAAAVDAR